MLQELRNLCGAIQTAIDDIETYQERNGGCEILPLPDNDFSVPAAIQEHRQELLDASRKLLDLAAGPLDRLRWLCTQVVETPTTLSTDERMFFLLIW